MSCAAKPAAEPSRSAPSLNCGSNAHRFQLQMIDPKHRAAWLQKQGCPIELARPAPGELCYAASTQAEYDRLLRLVKKKKKIIVGGVTYPCLENAVPAEPVCYRAKTKKEFVKLSRDQDAHPERPLKIAGKLYRCIQGVE